MPDDPLEQHSPEELFHLWKLAGGDLERHVIQQLGIPPAINRFPRIAQVNRVNPHQYVLTSTKEHVLVCLVRLTSCRYRPFRNVADPSLLYDSRIVPVCLTALRRRVRASTHKTRPKHFFSAELPPLAIREKDLDYQRHRILVFRRLLREYPASQRLIMQEAKIDIPPLLRSEIWAVVLGVGNDAEEQYASIDKESEGPSDHQIDLDIPRCHQYNPLLSSPEGHRKMRRILKAWVAHNTDMLYWQGLDSLLAPFLTLSFNDEARAYCCLQETVSKYLRNFFRRGNGMYLQAYLLVFRQLVAYHEPVLAWHLFKIGFHPELYAISWFLTLFTRTFTLARERERLRSCRY